MAQTMESVQATQGSRLATLPMMHKITKDFGASGVSIAYSSHKLAEVKSISDGGTILRDRHHVASHATSQLTHYKIVRFATGLKGAA